MLAQIEGRTADDVAYWLAMQRPAWRDQVQYVAIDMCTVFVSAIRRYLPGAQIVIDHFYGDLVVMPRWGRSGLVAGVSAVRTSG